MLGLNPIFRIYLQHILELSLCIFEFETKKGKNKLQRSAYFTFVAFLAVKFIAVVVKFNPISQEIGGSGAHRFHPARPAGELF